MSYFEFLGRWYNLAFLLLAALGAGIRVGARLRFRRPPGGMIRILSGTLIVAAVIGLTINGAIHDLALGDPGPRFRLVLAASTAAAYLAVRAYQALARRYFPRVRAVEVDSPDLAGLDARVVSGEVGARPRSGRAQRQSGDILHVVHCHAAEEGIAFGRTVRLVQFDGSSGSYLVKPSADA